MSQWVQSFQQSPGSYLEYWRDQFDEPTLNESQMKMYLQRIQQNEFISSQEKKRLSPVPPESPKIQISNLYKVDTVDPEPNPPTVQVDLVETVDLKEPGLRYKVTMWDVKLQARLEKAKYKYTKFKVGSVRLARDLFEDEFERACAPVTYVDSGGNVWERVDRVVQGDDSGR